MSNLVLTADDQNYDDTMLLLGNFAFDDIRDDWEDQEFEEDSYKGYEIWDGDNYYVLFEDQGAIVASDSEDLVKDFINVVDRGTGSLAEDQEGDMARIVAKLGTSPVIVALAGEVGKECGNALSGCAGIGAAFAGSDLDREEVTAELVVLFNSERRAERAADDYDDVADLMEEMLENLAEEADDFTGLPDANGADIDDITAEGEFILGIGLIEIELDE